MWSMAEPKVSVERATRPMGWNLSVLSSVPSWRPMAALVLTSPMARHMAKSSAVERSTRGWSISSWASPALRRTAEARTPSSSNRRKVLPEKRKCLFIGLLGFERSHVNGEAVLHIRLEQSLAGFVGFLDRDHFDIGGDVVLPAEVEHLLGFGDTADGRAGEAATPHDQGECRDGE